jgi:hypothetical protein
MSWIEHKEFPKGLDSDCYILAKNCNSIDEFEVFKYIKTHNEVYKTRN